MAQTKAQLLGPVVGDVVMDVSTLSLDAEGNKVGIGHSEPDLTLHVSGVDGLPSTSGSTSTGHLTLRDKATSTKGMFFGVSNASPFGSWIQAQDSANNATNYPLLLNPNGGNIGIGTSDPGSLFTLAVPSQGSGDTTFAGGQTPLLNSYRVFEWGLRVTGESSESLNGRSSIRFKTNPGTGGSDSEIGFWTNKYGISRGERMTITSTGNVGIGHLTPIYKVDVKALPSASSYNGLNIRDDSNTVISLYRTGSSYSFGSVGSNQAWLYSNTGDLNITSDGSGVIKFQGDNGAERLRITSGGEILIPAAGANRLNMRHTSGGNFVIKNPTAANLSFGTNDQDNELTIKNGGNVGIGDVSPSQKLNVGGNIMLEGTEGFMYLTNVGTGNAGIYVRGNSTSASNSNHFLRSHSTGMFTWEVTGSEKMRLTSDGLLIVNNTTQITGFANPSSGTGLELGYDGTRGVIQCYDRSTNTAKTLYLGGDVGIGDTSPNNSYGTNLSVHSTTTGGARLKISDGTTGKGNLDGLDIISTGGNAYIINRENSDMLFTTGDGAFSFTTNGSERFLIDSDGRTTAGDGNSTSGTTILQSNYSGSNKLNVIGSHHSSGGTTICYAVRPKTGSAGFVSSAGNGNLKKAALEINGEFIFSSAGAATVAIDSTVTLIQRMKIDISGKVGVGFTAESATLEVQGQNAYTSSANSLATSTSKAALRVKGSNNSSDSLWVGVETSNAQPYLQGANGIGNTAKNLLLNPFGANVGIGTTSPGAKLVVSGLSMSDSSAGVELEGSWPWLKFKDTEVNQASWIQYVDGGRFYIKEIDYADRNSTPSTVGTERLQIDGSGKVGIGGVSPDVRLHVRTSANEVGKFETTSTADMSIELKNSQGSMFFGLGGGEEFAVATSWDLNGSDNLFAIKQDGKVGINTTGPSSRLHVRDDITYGKTSYASASTGSGQTRPPGTFKWDNITPAGGSGRGYRGWVQSGDAYPNASSYFDLLVRNSGFYRVTVKRSHSSANASVATMLIYGLANSGGSNKPVVYISGITSSGSGTGTAQTGHGYGSSNPVANFYWTVVSYNINTHDTIIRIRTNTSNNQGIVALVEEI